MTKPEGGAQPKGLFISFEGIDGSGKSTQARRLHADLLAEGRQAVLTREPGGSPGAEEIRALVLQGEPDRWSAETELLLFTAARRDHLERLIRPALEMGKMVICDRFADSSRMYQGLSRGDLRDKVDAPTAGQAGVAASPVAGSIRDQVAEALVGLGFTAAPADKAVTAVLADEPDADASTVLRKSLALMGKSR